MRSPIVSVVIPTHERPELLCEAVESALKQTYSELELIVVDDASTTPVEPRLFERWDDERIRVIRHDENRGANAARNTGIAAATGTYIAFLDDDDRWDPEKIAVQVEAFQEGTGSLGVVIVGQRFVDDAGTTTGIKRPEINENPTDALFAGHTAGPFSTLMVRRDMIDEAGMPDERFPSLQDREWLLRLSQHCSFTSIDAPLVRRRMGGHDQIADQFEERRDVTYRLMLDKHRSAAAAYGREATFHASLARGVAGSALAAGAYPDARRFALRAIRLEPLTIRPYVYALASIGGYSYRPARRIKRHAARLVRG